MSTNPTQSRNRIITPILLGVSLIFAVFFLKPSYATYIENKAILSGLEKDFQVVDAEYKSLNKIKENISSVVSPEKLERIQKLGMKFVNSDVLATVMLNDYTKSISNESPRITIASATVNKGKKLPNGLSLGGVGINIQGKTIADIIGYITYLTQNTEYIFTLDSISLPIDTDPEEDEAGSYGLGINLGVYYYD